MMIRINSTLDDITSDLISIPSVTGEEAKICDEIEITMDSIGFTPSVKKGNNLVYTINNNSDKTLALIGHIDTVPPSKKDQTKPIIHEGNIYGLGAVDMKAGVACILKVAEDISRNNLYPNYNLKLVFYDGEEGDLPSGITKLIEKRVLSLRFAFFSSVPTLKKQLFCY